jgi:hypothetical protein
MWKHHERASNRARDRWLLFLDHLLDWDIDLDQSLVVSPLMLPGGPRLQNSESVPKGRPGGAN